MFRKGLAVAVILLFIGVAIAPSINAGVSKPDIDTVSMNKESDEDCGCAEETPNGWNYPFFCTLLYPIFWFGVTLLILGLPADWVYTIGDIGKELNCWWGRENILEVSIIKE